jgi:hypothetical protein
LYEVGAEGDVLIIALQGTIPAGGYYLVERTDDSTISDISADLYGSFGGSGFKNDPGEELKLKDGGGFIVDSIPCSSGWFAGDNAEKRSMERINPLLSGSDPVNWATHSDPDYGSDAGLPPNRIKGSPRAGNSVTTP